MPGINHLLVSSIIHGILAFSIFGWPAITPRPEPEPEVEESIEEDSELLTESELVTEDELPVNQIEVKKGRMEQPEEPVVELAPPAGAPIDETAAEELSRIDFAGAPPGTAGAEQSSTVEPPRSGPGLKAITSATSQGTGQQAESLMTADFTNTAGVKAPSVFFANVTIAHMERMANAGQGAFLAIFSTDNGAKVDNVFVVNGSIVAPSGISEASRMQLDRLSERTLPIPESYRWVVLTQLENNLGFERAEARKAVIVFAMSNAVDHRVLQRQREAAANVSSRLEDVQKTTGRLIVTDRGAEDFRVTQVRLKDGRVFNANVN